AMVVAHCYKNGQDNRCCRGCWWSSPSALPPPGWSACKRMPRWWR
ncbi:inner membrane transporter YdhC, partial [Klebsiella variicola]